MNMLGTSAVNLCLPISFIFIVILFGKCQAMTISRDDLSQFFNEFLDTIEKHAEDSENFGGKTGSQTEAHILERGGNNSQNLSEKLSSILRDIHHVESKLEEDSLTLPTALEKAETADELVIELLNESRHDIRNEALDNEPQERTKHDKVVKKDSIPSENDKEDEVDRLLAAITSLNTTRTTASSKTQQTGKIPLTLTNITDGTDMGLNVSKESSPYNYAQCELRLNERLEPLTLARFHGFRGTVNVRQNRFNGSSEILIRLYGVEPNTQGYDIFIRVSGDLSRGCNGLGEMSHTESIGRLGVVSQTDESGFAELRSTDISNFDLSGKSSIYGKSIVVHENGDPSSAPIGCCVIGISFDWRIWK